MSAKSGSPRLAADTFLVKGGELRPRVAGDDIAGEVESPGVARRLAAAQREGGKITLHVHPEHAAAVHRRTLEDVDRLDALVDVVGNELEFGRAERGRLGNRPEQHVHVGALDRRFALRPRGVGKAEPARGAVDGVQLLPYSGAAGCRQQVADANVPGDALHCTPEAVQCSPWRRGIARVEQFREGIQVFLCQRFQAFLDRADTLPELARDRQRDLPQLRQFPMHDALGMPVKKVEKLGALPGRCWRLAQKQQLMRQFLGVVGPGPPVRQRQPFENGLAVATGSRG